MAKSTEKKLTKADIEKLIEQHLDKRMLGANGRCPSCDRCSLCGHTPSPRPLPWWGSPWVSPYITWEAPRWQWYPNGVTYESTPGVTTLGQFTVTNDVKV